MSNRNGEISVGFLISTPIVIHIKGLMKDMSEKSRFKVLIAYDVTMGNEGTIRDEYADIKNMTEVTKSHFASLRNYYIFLSSPYDCQRTINTKTLKKYNKVLNVNYGYHIHRHLYRFTYKVDHFQTFYATFHECAENYHDYIDHMKEHLPQFNDKTAHLSGSTKIAYLSQNRDLKDYSIFKQDGDTERIRILFSFRWMKTYNNCNYDRYYKHFMNLSTNHSELDLIYRPHPLSPHKELEKFQNDNYYLDRSCNYTNIFNVSSFLISDLSTLIVDYFIFTSKPIILMKGKMLFDQSLNSLGKKIIKGIYVVTSLDELDKTIKMLVRGEDPLKETREKLAGELNNFNGIEYIVNFIIRDHSNQSNPNFGPGLIDV